MASAKTYLLDTNVLLHWVRGSTVAQNIDAQFQLSASAFRPPICEVTLGEMAAFAAGNGWGAAKQQKLTELKTRLVAVDISDSRVIDAYAEYSTLAKTNGWAIFHDKNDLWIAAATRVSGATLLTTDVAGFLPLRDSRELNVIVFDPTTGWKLP